MKRKNWKHYLFYILLTEAVGIVAGLLIREGTLMAYQSRTNPVSIC